MENLKEILGIIAIGFLIVVGMRLAEWTISEPPSKLVVCIANTDKNLSDCKPSSYYQ